MIIETPIAKKRLTVRLKSGQDELISRLTEQAGYTTAPEFIRKLIDHLGQTTASFDLRDITVQPRKK